MNLMSIRQQPGPTVKLINNSVFHSVISFHFCNDGRNQNPKRQVQLASIMYLSFETMFDVD